jgi:hypothetical protein
MIKESDVIISKKVCEKQNWMIMEVGIELESSPGLLKLFDIESGQTAHLFEAIESELPATVITEIYGDVRELAKRADVLLTKIAEGNASAVDFDNLSRILYNLKNCGLHEELEAMKPRPVDA